MPTPLSTKVAADLRRRIAEGSLAPGARLPSEHELIEAFGVSRAVVREAVTRLRAEGLLETQRGRGSFVLAVPAPTPFALESSQVRNQADVLAMIDFRIGVESEAARLAARADLDPQEAAAIEAALAAYSTATAEEAVESDFAFHHAIAHASGNRFFVDLIASLGPMMILLPRAQMPEPFSATNTAHVENVRTEHANIAAAVLAGDAETAAAAMRVHLGNARRRLRS